MSQLRWQLLRVGSVILGPWLLVRGWEGLQSGGGQVQGDLVRTAQAAGVLQVLLGLVVIGAGVLWVVERRRERDGA